MVQLHSKGRVFLRAGDLSKTAVPRVEEKISADDSAVVRCDDVKLVSGCISGSGATSQWYLWEY